MLASATALGPFSCRLESHESRSPAAQPRHPRRESRTTPAATPRRLPPSPMLRRNAAEAGSARARRHSRSAHRVLLAGRLPERPLVANLVEEPHSPGLTHPPVVLVTPRGGTSLLGVEARVCANPLRSATSGTMCPKSDQLPFTAPSSSQSVGNGPWMAVHPNPWAAGRQLGDVEGLRRGTNDAGRSVEVLADP